MQSVWWRKTSRWNRTPSLSLQPMSAEKVKRASSSGKREPGRPRRPTHPRGRREVGKKKATFAPKARADSRDPGDSGVGAGPSPRPSGSTHSATGQQESHSQRPPPSVPPGDGAADRFRVPLYFPPQPDWAAQQTVRVASAGPRDTP